jgi:redox-sensitive bicupin YhaK (pirin superfamily)
MPIQFSPVIDTQPRGIPAFNSLHYVDLEALGVYGSPLSVLDDFRVQELPFSAHPHAGFSAVTYVFEDSPGAVRSRTSTGADLVVGPGGIVWTQAGSGIIHEEVPAERGRELHGLQLFVNLTSSHKLSPPRLLHLDGRDVPVWHSEAGDRVRVVVGAFDGVASPLAPDETFALLDIKLKRQMPYLLRAGQNSVIYVLSGSLLISAGNHLARVGSGQAQAVSGNEDVATLEAVQSAHLLILTGIDIDEPVVEEGPFIMNSRAQIQAAIARYQSGAMGGLSPIQTRS